MMGAAPGRLGIALNRVVTVQHTARQRSTSGPLQVAGGCLRSPGGREVTPVPTATTYPYCDAFKAHAATSVF
jgi:hypothetical protein